MEAVHKEDHAVVLVKHSQRALNDKAVRNNTNGIVSGTNSRSLAGQGWTVEPADPSFSTGPYEGTDPKMTTTSRLHLHVHFERRDGKAPGKGDLATFVRKLHQKASVPLNGKWSVEKINDEPYDAEAAVTLTDLTENIGYADCEIPEDFEQYFRHLYGLDDPIEILRSRIQAGIDSGWTDRFHTVFVGPPGCGKSAVAEALMEALGPDAVIRYDATAMTSAGVIKDLSEREILPRVAVWEECEKIPNKDVSSFLLGIMDQRAELRKVTARTNISKECKLYCIATVNDYNLFQTLQKGALASRFGVPVGFNKPSREMKALILAREIERVGGDDRWIDATLDYCEEVGIDDTRAMIGICLAGRNELLTGKYQERLRRTTVAQTQELFDWSQEVDLDSDDE